MERKNGEIIEISLGQRGKGNRGGVNFRRCQRKEQRGEQRGVSSWGES